MLPGDFLVAIEGGGSRTQAALLDVRGRLIAVAEAADVNVNFTTPERAAAAMSDAITAVLQAGGVAGDDVAWVAHAFVSSPEIAQATLRRACPRARLQAYTERDVVFARAGSYRPHGVAVVAGTGATAFAIRQDDGRQVALGGWGSLLGDEGSAYAIGLLGLRVAARAWEGRESPTTLVDAVRRHFALNEPDFKRALIVLAYGKPLSRAEVASFARAIVQCAEDGDPVAGRIVDKAARDLATLSLHAASRLFDRQESFQVVAAGGLIRAGERILGPLRERLRVKYPRVVFAVGTEEPAVALGRRALFDLSQDERLPC